MLVGMQYQKDAKYKMLVYLIVIVGILGAYPYVFNQMFPIPGLSLLAVFVCISLAVISIGFKSVLAPLPHIFNVVFLIQTIAWVLYILLHRDFSYVERVVFMIEVYAMILCIYNCRGGLYAFFEKYNKWVVYMVAGGAICFFLVLFLGIPYLYSYPNKDGRMSYCFLLTTTNVLRGSIIRFAGFFDEPGAMAFWGIWALLFNKLYFRNEKYEKILMICLVFTLSMAYYIQIFFYLLFYKVKSVKHIILIVVAILVLGGGIYYASEKIPGLYTLTFSRFETDNTGKLRGDNRSELAELAKVQFEKAPLIGVGNGKASEMEYMSDNPYETLAFDGIIGTIITYLPLIYLWVISGKEMRFAIIILALGFLQRPFHHYILYYFMLYGLMLLSINKQKNENTYIRHRGRRASFRVCS